jgi:hypothetical protein
MWPLQREYPGAANLLPRCGVLNELPVKEEAELVEREIV